MSETNEGARQEWRGWPLRSLLAATVYLVVTGLVILLAPFGAGAQVSVIAHTIGGLLFLVPLFWYLGPHFVRRVGDKFSHLVLLGWMAGLLMLAVVVSGLVVTIQAAFGRRMDYGWDLVHTVTGCAVGVLVIAHCLTAVRKSQHGERAAVNWLVGWTTVVGIVLGAVTFFAGGLFTAPATRQPLPENYGLRYGENPFAPSLATTDYLWRVEKDRLWLRFLDELGKDPTSATPDGVADFLAGAERQHRADTASRQRGEKHIDALGRLEIDGERITALRALAGPDGADKTALATLRAKVAADLDDAKKQFDEHGGLRPDAMAGSRTCGTEGCHEEILAEWEPSAHRYSSRSSFFQLIQGAMAESNGAESTRYCAGCHDPISLFSGGKNIFQDDLSSAGADEGISCISCHSIVQTDLQGNANYVIAPPEPYLAEDSFLGRFLIRSYPRHHKATFGRPLLETPEFCAACHKQFIDKEVNRSTRVQLQNQYDGWKGSHWFVPDEKHPDRANPDESLSCRDCHMRLVKSDDPAAEDGHHRHHGHIAANQWLPILHKLPHAEKHVKLTEEWLQGKTVIPEIADRWPGGPPVPLRIEAPKTARIGEKVKIRVIADNRKVGHTFPTGPLDVIQAWIEVRVTQDGREIFSSGALDKDGFIESGAWMLKAEGVDRAGNLIDRHNLWDMVGARFRRVLFPGTTDQEEYTFECACGDSPRGIEGGKAEFVVKDGGPLEVTAVLHYRKVDQTLLNVLKPDGKSRAPVTDMSHASARIELVEAQ